MRKMAERTILIAIQYIYISFTLSHLHTFGTSKAQRKKKCIHHIWGFLLLLDEMSLWVEAHNTHEKYCSYEATKN